MKQFVFASNNKNKLREVREILKGYSILSLDDLGLKIEIEETGKTFEENSFIKAKTVFDLCGVPALADDSGLMVDVLGGAPGVYSARYSGENATDESNNALLLKNLDGAEDRSARFVCVITFYDGKQKLSATGETEGYILTEPSGTQGFGYDSLFYSAELRKSFGVADEKEKNAVSHRAKALKKMANKLKNYY